MDRGAAGLPRWLLGRQPAHNPGEKRHRFLNRTLGAAMSFAEDTLFNETVSARKGFLQKVEPRIKLPVLLLLVVALSLEKDPAHMLPYAAFALAMAALSAVPMGVYFKRLLPAVVLTAAIALPATLNIVVKGDELFHLFSLGRQRSFLGVTVAPDVFITRQGLESAAGLVGRAGGSLMLVFLAGFTTPPARLVKSLRAALPGFPGAVVAVSYRYMFFFVRRLDEFVMAQKARGAGLSPGFSGRQWAGSRAASVLLVALKLKDELGMAMEARAMGYSARQDAGRISFGRYEMLFLAASTAVLLI